MNKKSAKNKYVDDGHTLYDMSGVGSPEQLKHTEKESKAKVGLTFKEKMTAIKAAFQVYAPIFFGVLACFTVVALMLWLWLK